MRTDGTAFRYQQMAIGEALKEPGERDRNGYVVVQLNISLDCTTAQARYQQPSPSMIDCHVRGAALCVSHAIS